MRYLSLFSGVEAATLAWEGLGFEPVAFCEFDAFPSAVLAYHWPAVPNLGDVTKITEKQIKALGKIDIVVFGSPCQDLSVAGMRKGFDGERSGLFRDAIKIIGWARKHCGLRFALWENVPGAFTSNKGADFCEVLSSLSGSKQPQPEKWGGSGVCFGKAGLVEWATLDAQFFGVPQRRRRVFALADFGDWTRRQPLFPQPDSLRWNFETSREAEEGTASKTGRRLAIGSHWDDSRNAHPTLNQSHNTGGIAMSNQELFSQRGGGLVETFPQGMANHLIPFDMTAFGQYGDGKSASTCKARDYKDATDLVVCPINDKDTRHNGVSGKGSGNGLGICENGDSCPTLTTGGRHAIYAFQPRIARNGRGDMHDKVNALTASAGETGKGDASPCVAGYGLVRRLTPVECERLQGMPDNHTRIPWKGRPAEECPDGPRYKAIGNSMAVPVMRWIGEQIAKAV